MSDDGQHIRPQKGWSFNSNFAYFIYSTIVSFALAAGAGSWAGYQAGQKKGYADAEATFNANLPQRLKEAYHDELKNAARVAYDNGHAQGLADGATAAKPTISLQVQKANADGFTAGFSAGEQKGKKEALSEVAPSVDEECDLIQNAKQNWLLYQNLVHLAATLSKQAFDRPARGTVEAVVNVAHGLHQDYDALGNAFDSTIEDLQDAIQHNDLRRMQSLIVTLNTTLPIKQQLYITGTKEITSAFSGLADREKNR